MEPIHLLGYVALMLAAFALSLAVINAILSFLTFGIRYLFFFPYRNRLTRWYMMRFSPHYKNAKCTYGELLQLERRCRKLSVDRHAGYYMLYEMLLNDSRFDMAHSQEEMIGWRTTRIHSDDILKNKWKHEDVTIFHTSYGSENKLHKVCVFFDTSSDTQLAYIMLLYTEEVRLPLRWRMMHTYHIETRGYTPDPPLGDTTFIPIRPLPAAAV